MITTYTESNEREIREIFAHIHGHVPPNVTVQTWFSFLLQHGVRPYQSVLDDSIHQRDIGFFLTNTKSGRKTDTSGRPLISKGRPLFWGEKDFHKYYFTSSLKIYSDKIAKFIVQCNKASNGKVLTRISQIFSRIFVDEVQDLAGFDLEILKLLFRSRSEVLLVGDPRQVTYLTHHSSKYKKYSSGNIRSFVENELGKRLACEVDEETLAKSHRNPSSICKFSSKLYPLLPPSSACTCNDCRRDVSEHDGLFWIADSQVNTYLSKFHPTQLRWNSTVKHNSAFPVLNFGEAKGRSFDRVLIYPTKDMARWLLDHQAPLGDEARAKLYVAITRARSSATFVLDPSIAGAIEGLKRY